MRGSGGTDGGLDKFLIGFLLAALGIYFFFDSVRVSSAGDGMLSGMMRGGRRGGGGLRETTSMGILFVPFFLGVVALFVDSKMKWAWGLLYFGIAVLVIEILSRIRFFLEMKTTALLGMIFLFAAGTGLMISSYQEAPVSNSTDATPPDSEQETKS